MKKNRWLLTKGVYLIALVMSLGMISCDDNTDYIWVDNNLPNPQFEVVASVYDVTLTNKSTDALGYVWNFGDGSGDVDTITRENFTYTYTKDGIYTISLKGTDKNNTDSTFTMVVSIPYLSFNHTVNWGTATFVNNEPTASSWLWDFGDGATSTLENPVHEYLLEGKYTVTCVASNGSASNTYVEAVETDSAVIQNPLFDGDRGLWSMDGSSTYSGSGSPTPIQGSGAKLGSSSQYLYQEVKVFPNQKYRVTFYAAIDDKGVEGKTSPFAVYAGAGISGTQLVDANLAAEVNSNKYTGRSFDFTTDDSGYVTIHGTYGDVTIRYCVMDISPV